MNPRFLDHFENPRNVGAVENPHGSAEVENPVCGDRIEVTLALEGDRVVTLNYRVLGCSGAIAAASAMSELAIGRLVVEARLLSLEDVDQALGGLPTLKRHGADLAIEGLVAALDSISERS